MKTFHCAERGCDVVEQPGADDDEPLCPTCGHPLAFTETDDPEGDTDPDDPHAHTPEAPTIAKPEETVRQAAARRNRRV